MVRMEEKNNHSFLKRSIPEGCRGRGGRVGNGGHGKEMKRQTPLKKRFQSIWKGEEGKEEEFVRRKSLSTEGESLFSCSGGIFADWYTRFWSRFWPTIYFGLAKVHDSGIGGTQRRLSPPTNLLFRWAVFMKQKKKGKKGVSEGGWMEPLFEFGGLSWFSFFFCLYRYVFFKPHQQNGILQWFADYSSAIVVKL